MIEISDDDNSKEIIAKSIAKIFNDRDEETYVNLGVGTPTMVSNYVDNNYICVQAENGILDVGPEADEGEEDPKLIDAGRNQVTENPGSSYFNSAKSFGMIRGRHIDFTVVGAFEVDEKGNLANWTIPNSGYLGVGGAMDLVTGAKNVIIAMPHSRNGKTKIKKECSLPLTGLKVVDKVVTELAVFSFEKDKLVLKEKAPNTTVEDIRDLTGAEFEVESDLKEMW